MTSWPKMQWLGRSDPFIKVQPQGSLAVLDNRGHPIWV